MPVGMHQGQPCRPVLLCHWLGETLPGIHLRRVVVIPELRELNTIFSDSQSASYSQNNTLGFLQLSGSFGSILSPPFIQKCCWDSEMAYLCLLFSATNTAAFFFFFLNLRTQKLGWN